MASDETRPPNHYLCWCGTVVSPGKTFGATLYETDGEVHQCPLPREEIGRAAHETPEVSDKPRSGARVSTGVRVRVTEEATSAGRDAFWGNMESTASALEAAAPHMQVTVDRETRARVGAEIRLALQDGGMTPESVADVILENVLGLTLTDGDSDA